jgi:hypothetical protein
VPSPFPGMDPYLEGFLLWPDVHHRLISEVDRQLQPQLNPRGYYIRIGSRAWVERPNWAFVPDLTVSGKSPRPEAIESAGGIVVADEPVRLPILEQEFEEAYLQIHENETNGLITGIELISLRNKSARRRRPLYLKRRKLLLHTGVNLVEVDLHRRGRPLVRLPTSVLETHQPGGYVINVMRTDTPSEFEFYPVDLRSRLPRVGIPLKSGDPDVVLDLQAALASVYEAGAYAMRIDYNRDTHPSLDRNTKSWAHELLIAAGLRELPKPAPALNGPNHPNE